MAEDFDVCSRLADGEPAVENLHRYVWACHQLGYQHPDLTVHAGQMWDWYGSEDGMDLTALHGDWRALEDAAGASQDALAVQDRQLSALPAVWQGAGAEASQDFLRRHAEASAAAAAAVRTAAEALGALRESLWRAVNAKVDAVVAIEGRAQAHRADWLAAAATVTTGAGDRAVAAELVDQAVKPFVDSSIGSDWLTAIRTAISSTTDAYQSAAAEMAAERHPVFDVPSDFGPTWSRPPARIHGEPGFEDRVPATAPAGALAPASPPPSAWSAPPAAAATPLTAAAAPMPTPPAAAGLVAPPSEAPVGPTVPPLSSLGGMGPGMPDIGGGLSGLGQQFADMLSGLLGGADGVVPQPLDLDVPELDDPPDLDAADEADDDAADDAADETDDETDDDEADAEDSGEDEAEEPVEDPILAGEIEPEASAGPVDGTAEVPADSAPAPAPAPPPAEPMPPNDLSTADPLAAEQTPCAIAADELPQVGEAPE